MPFLAVLLADFVRKDEKKLPFFYLNKEKKHEKRFHID